MFNWSDYQNIVHFPPPSDVPRISMNLSINQGFCKCNISRVERGKGGGKEVFMTVINLPPGQLHDRALYHFWSKGLLLLLFQQVYTPCCGTPLRLRLERLSLDCLKSREKKYLLLNRQRYCLIDSQTVTGLSQCHRIFLTYYVNFRLMLSLGLILRKY